jgi:hypothetical protein
MLRGFNARFDRRHRRELSSRAVTRKISKSIDLVADPKISYICRHPLEHPIIARNFKAGATSERPSPRAHKGTRLMHAPRVRVLTVGTVSTGWPGIEHKLRFPHANCSHPSD